MPLMWIEQYRAKAGTTNVSFEMRLAQKPKISIRKFFEVRDFVALRKVGDLVEVKQIQETIGG